MARHDDLSVLLRTARQLAKLCSDAVRLLNEARIHQADPVVVAAARKMHSETLRTKHAAEDALVASVLQSLSKPLDAIAPGLGQLVEEQDPVGQ